MIRAVAAAVVVALSIGAFVPSARSADEPATSHTTGDVAAHAPTTETIEAGASTHGEGEDAAHGDGTVAHHGDVPHPTKSADADWAGVVIIIVLGMFLAAAVIGPIVRANMPEEVPATHSHDEPPGASHHHGHSGQLNPEPESDVGHGHGGHH